MLVLSRSAGGEPRLLQSGAANDAVRQAVDVLKNPDEPRQEDEVLPDRVSRLGAAVLRVSASLDPNTVLQELVDSARALTGVR